MLVVHILAQEHYYIPTALVVHGVIYAILCHEFCMMHHCVNYLSMHLLIMLIFHGHVLYCYRYSWVKITGTEYRPGDILVQKFTDDSPTFCRLNKVYSDSCGNFYFDCVQLETPHYDSHYHAYIVDTSSNVASVLCQQDELCDHQSYSVYHSFDPALRNVHFVVPKYHIIDYLPNCILHTPISNVISTTNYNFNFNHHFEQPTC